MINITITNSGNDPSEVVTIFINDGSGNSTLLEANTSITVQWDPANPNVRYEVVPWIRTPAP